MDGFIASKQRLSAVPIEQLLMCSGFDLKPYGMDAWCSMVEPYLLVIFWRAKQGEERKAIQVQIPTYEKYHPEKIEAETAGIFMTGSFIRHKEYHTKEVDWEGFKSKFITACLELKRQCA